MAELRASSLEDLRMVLFRALGGARAKMGRKFVEYIRLIVLPETYRNGFTLPKSLQPVPWAADLMLPALELVVDAFRRAPATRGAKIFFGDSAAFAISDHGILNTPPANSGRYGKLEMVAQIRLDDSGRPDGSGSMRLYIRHVNSISHSVADLRREQRTGNRFGGGTTPHRVIAVVAIDGVLMDQLISLSERGLLERFVQGGVEDPKVAQALRMDFGAVELRRGGRPWKTALAAFLLGVAVRRRTP
jgi:hypothetical protein